MTAERLAELFHTALERRVGYFYLTQRMVAPVSWQQAPTGRRQFMLSASHEVLAQILEETAQEAAHAYS